MGIAMKRERIANRLLDAIVVGLVVTIVGFAATAPRAERAGGAVVNVVEAPGPACAHVAPSNRAACLTVAQAVALHR